MRSKFAYAALPVLAPLLAAAFSGSACAMNSPLPHAIDCRVINGDKLPADSGGADALCAAIARAAAADAPGKTFSVEVRVLGSASLAATLTTADGKILPEQKLAISDRELSRGSLERFAKALVGQIVHAASR